MEAIQIQGLSANEFWQEMRKIIREETNIQPEKEQVPVDYSVKQARAALADKGKPPIDYKTFRKHLRLNGIQPYRTVGRTKYYLHKDLFKTQAFK
jgi:hypothetical protein